MKKPKVTVLMPVYNGEVYIREAVESILAQTFSDFEFLVINDHSTDESLIVLESFNDKRIRIINNPANMGQVASMNRGVEFARGSYIARMDQDDVSLPDRLELQVNELDRAPKTAVVGSWIDYMDSKGRLLMRKHGRICSLADFLCQLLAGKSYLYHPAVMFRKSSFLAAGKYADISPAEDFELWTKFAVKGFCANVLPCVLLKYRRHSGQGSLKKLHIGVKNKMLAHQNFISRFVPVSMFELVSSFFNTDPAACLRKLLIDENALEIMSDSLRRLLANMLINIPMKRVERDELILRFHMQCRKMVYAQDLIYGSDILAPLQNVFTQKQQASQRFSRHASRFLSDNIDAKTLAAMDNYDSLFESHEALALKLSDSAQKLNAFASAFVRQKWKEISENNTKIIALFPNGLHTQWLFSVLGDQLTHSNCVVFDDNRHDIAGNCKKVKALHTRQIEKTPFDIAVLSSDAPGHELRKRAEHLFGTRLRILYEGLPTGPYAVKDQLYP